MSTTIVLDFETTGLSPDHGARATEVGAIRLENGRIVDSFQSLMNAGVRIPRFIEQYTGITNAMVRKAPPAAEIIATLARFIGNVPLVAHNASFDSKFLDAELARIGLRRRQEIACSVLVARRVYPDAPSYKLGALVQHLGLPSAGVYHRALADATLTAHLWLAMQMALQSQYRLSATPFALMKRLQQVPKRQVASYLRRSAAL